MTESQPPLTRRELREMRARREAELQNRAATAADEAPGQGPGASPRVPDQAPAEAPSQAVRRQRRPADPAPGTLFLPRTAPTPPAAPAPSAPAPAPSAPAPAARPEPDSRPAHRPGPAAGPAQRSAPAEPAAAPAPAAPPVEPTPAVPSAGPAPSAPVVRPSVEAPASDAHTSRRKERLRRQAEQARLAALSGEQEAEQADDTFIPGATAQPNVAQKSQAAPASPAPAAPSRLSTPARPQPATPQAADAAPTEQAASAARQAPSAPSRPAPSTSAAQRPSVSRPDSAPQASSAAQTGPAPAASSPSPTSPAPSRPSPSVPPVERAQAPAARPAPAPTAPVDQPSASEDHASHRRRRAGAQHHSPELQAALGASPTLEAAQAEIEAMAAAREAALRRALARRKSTPPEESFSSALGLPPTGSAAPHVPRIPAATQPEQARPPRSARRPGEREAQFPAPGTPTGPVPWQRPETAAPSASPATDAGEARAEAGAATSFSDLLGIPSAPPANDRPRRGGRRARPAQVENRAAQKRLENTGLISPVTQEVSVVVPKQRTAAAARAQAEAEAADSTGPISASSAHGLDPLEYKSAGVQRSRWGLVVVLASVLVAATAVVWALLA